MRNEEKLKRLVQIARFYYEEGRSQAEIAALFSVSRPMVSKLLAEARERGIVTIHITEATSFHQVMEEQLKGKFGIKNAVVVPMERDEERTNGAIVRAGLSLSLQRLGEGGCLGVGWGSLIGKLADYLEGERLSGVVCPLIGNAAASYRSYHPNELVRVISGKTGLSPAYIYGPAIAETVAEKELYQNTDSYGQMKQLWSRLDVAMVNVSNHPSSPDMATALRFGLRLSAEKAVGHVLSYFYDVEGRIVQEENDRLLRISPKELKKAGCVAALCASGVKAVSAVGAMRSGLITDLILNEELAAELLRQEFEK